MNNFHSFLTERLAAEGFSTEDALASFLPLMRQTLEAHEAGLVAPLEGLADLHVEHARIWFEQAKRQPLRQNLEQLRRTQVDYAGVVEIVSETRRDASLDEGDEKITHYAISERGEPVVRPVYLPGYVAWEHEIEHHDPLTDIFSLGMVLASLACGLDFTEPSDLEQFVLSRENLFRIQPDLHPVLARVITKMTEVDRHRRAQDLPTLLKTLDNYRDQEIDFDFDLARIQGLQNKDAKTRQFVVLSKLKERLFELSKRNRMLHFRATMQSVNLTQASIPLSFDVKNFRAEQILVWNQSAQREFISGHAVSLNKFLNFTEAIYLPGVLDRIIAEARRDEAEYGFAQLRLVVCYLHWANLKERPIEQFDSPLALLPAKLSKKKGIRDTYWLQVLETEAEINPVVRHQFKQLYDIDLPDRIDLAKTDLDEFYTYLARKIEAGDVSVTLKKIDRPRVSLIHERAKRRLDQYRRRARLAGRGVRKFQDLDYSYDPANYHPLGIKLYSAKVRTPSTTLRSIIEERPRPRSFMVAPAREAEAVKERSFYSLHEGGEENPYTWTFDLCSVTLANFKYRKMSLVRDYETLLGEQPANEAFESVFSLAPRPIQRALCEPPPLRDRYDVVPCDPTQAAAIEEARSGTSYIIQGPPGTGKSQTITNLIADFAAHGKRVLFVCEKRAAIDVVFARLRQVGLKELCCLIHDTQTDKKDFIQDLKQSYESFLSEQNGSSRQVRRRTVLKKMSAEIEALSTFDAAMSEQFDTAGMPVRQLLDHCIRLRDLRPELKPAEEERLPFFAQWDCARGHIAEYIKALSHVQPDGVASRHPWSFVAAKLAQAQHPIEIVSTAAEAARQALAEILPALRASGVSADKWSPVAQAAELVAYATRLQRVTEIGQAALLDEKSSAAKQFAAGLRQLEERRQAAGEAVARAQGWRQPLSKEELELALEQAQAFDASFFAWLSLRWWRLRGIMQRCYDFKSHVVKPTWRQALLWLQEMYARQDEVQAQEQRLASQFGIPGQVSEFVDHLAHLRTEMRTAPEWLRRIHEAVLKSPEPGAIVERMVSAAEPLSRLRQELDGFVADIDQLRLDTLDERLSEALDSLEELPDYLAALRELEDVPEQVRAALRGMPLDPCQLEAATAHRALTEFYRGHRDIAHFMGQHRYRHALSLGRQYDRWLHANAREIRRAAVRRFLKNIHICNQPTSQLTQDEKELKKRYNRGRRELEHEFGKSMRYKPIRELVSGDSGEVVKDVKPVWLMSPLSVSDTLPLDTNHFDVVIFDEASQITLEESVPSIFRAPQSIVVGDEMQLPPTDFFSAKRDSSEEDELLVEEGDEVVQYDLDSNSFLNHAAKNLPSTMLGWHYRSRSESLISFSNWKFYDGRLLTVPDEQLADQTRPAIVAQQPADAAAGAEALLQRPISFHFVQFGVYENRCNRGEAEYIAGLVRTLLAEGDGKTIGVVAFSEAQQSEIEAALRQLAEEDREFAYRLEAEYEREEDGQFVGLLVKNLENIQGDERDVIILSVCYGRDAAGKMRMNFGPINKSGGEKRLNVAFSRAKKHMALVSSISHADITNDYNDGANCLKQYLRYAEAVSSGNSDVATSVLRGIAHHDEAVGRAGTSLLAEQIASVLTKRGLLVDQHVGQSHFRCHLAVRRPQDYTYRLGILIDDAEHYEQADILERDVMRPRLLRAFGWRLTHVMAKDWYEDPVGETQRLLRLIDGEEDLWLTCDVHDADDADEDEQDDEQAGNKTPGSQEPLPLGVEETDEELRLAEAIEADLSHKTMLGARHQRRYLEFKDARSHKFWEITLNGSSHTVRFGRIGSAGQSLTKAFSDEDSARQDFERQLEKKMRKGYQ